MRTVIIVILVLLFFAKLSSCMDEVEAACKEGTVARIHECTLRRCTVQLESGAFAKVYNPEVQVKDEISYCTWDKK